MADQEISTTVSNNSDHRRDFETGGGTTTPESTPDVHGAGAKIERAKIAYRAHVGIENKPEKLEVFGWCFYGFCSYFVHTVLIPVLFPLIISQISMPWPDNNYANLPPTVVVLRRGRSLVCSQKQLMLYQRATNQTITVGGTKFSPLEWTSISWGIGLAVAAPLLALLSAPLDRGPRQSLIGMGAVIAGAVSCLPVGLFRTVWTFPLYIAAISAAAAVTSAHHTRHLSLMLRSFITSSGPALHRRRFPLRRAASSWLSLAASAFGSLGAAVIAAFSYQMLRGRSEPLMSLWIVSIFGGLKWILGSLHFVISSPRSQTLTTVESSLRHSFSILAYPHAIGGLISVFLSSLSTAAIFAGAVLYVTGELCLNPKSLLYLALAYFLLPFISLPVFHPVQQLIKANAVKMKLLGLFITATVSGIGFASKSAEWSLTAATVVAAVQGTSAGLLHAFGRVLMLDCTPRGKEGAFSAWLVWVRAAGSCIGYAVASASPGNAGLAFGLGFFFAVAASVVLIFGNVSDLGGAVAAGLVRGEEEYLEERGSPVNGVDTVGAHSGGVEVKRVLQEAP